MQVSKVNLKLFDLGQRAVTPFSPWKICPASSCSWLPYLDVGTAAGMNEPGNVTGVITFLFNPVHLKKRKEHLHLLSLKMTVGLNMNLCVVCQDPQFTETCSRWGSSVSHMSFETKTFKQINVLLLHYRTGEVEREAGEIIDHWVIDIKSKLSMLCHHDEIESR